MENFRRFAPSEALSCPNFGQKWKIFGASRLLKYLMKIFIGTGVKKQGRNWHILVPGRWRIETFGQNNYPCCWNYQRFSNPPDRGDIWFASHSKGNSAGHGCQENKLVAVGEFSLRSKKGISPRAFSCDLRWLILVLQRPLVNALDIRDEVTE